MNGSYESDDTQTQTYADKGFLQTAFTSKAQTKIATTTVDNSAASTTDAEGNITQATSYACDKTSDKIFLLSEKEVTTTDYGFAAYNSYGTGNARIRVTTDYAKANYACQNTTSGYGGDWWLRSPDNFGSDYTSNVNYSGEANCAYSIVYISVGVVPALTISLE